MDPLKGPSARHLNGLNVFQTDAGSPASIHQPLNFPPKPCHVFALQGTLRPHLVVTYMSVLSWLYLVRICKLQLFMVTRNFYEYDSYPIKVRYNIISTNHSGVDKSIRQLACINLLRIARRILYLLQACYGCSRQKLHLYRRNSTSPSSQCCNENLFKDCHCLYCYYGRVHLHIQFQYPAWGRIFQLSYCIIVLRVDGAPLY